MSFSNFFSKSDEEMQYYDTELKEDVKVVAGTLEGGTISTESLDQILTFGRSWNEKASDAISVCMNDIISKGGKGSKGKKRMTEFRNLVEEYAYNSQQMLEFNAELEGFLKLVKDSHSYTKQVVQEYFEQKVKRDGQKGSSSTRDDYMRVWENLKNLRNKYDSPRCAAAELLEKVENLIQMNQTFLENLKSKEKKIAKEHKTTRTLRKVVSPLFIVSVAAILLCSIATAVFVSPAIVFLAPSITVGIAAGKHRIDRIKELERVRRNEEKNLGQMQDETNIHITGLGNIKHRIDKVVNEIDSLLFHTNSTPTDEAQVDFAMNDIKNKLGMFLKKIEDLEVRADEFSSDLQGKREEANRCIQSLHRI